MEEGDDDSEAATTVSETGSRGILAWTVDALRSLRGDERCDQVEDGINEADDDKTEELKANDVYDTREECSDTQTDRRHQVSMGNGDRLVDGGDGGLALLRHGRYANGRDNVNRMAMMNNYDYQMNERMKYMEDQLKGLREEIAQKDTLIKDLEERASPKNIGKKKGGKTARKRNLWADTEIDRENARIVNKWCADMFKNNKLLPENWEVYTDKKKSFCSSVMKNIRVPKGMTERCYYHLKVVQAVNNKCIDMKANITSRFKSEYMRKIYVILSS